MFMKKISLIVASVFLLLACYNREKFGQIDGIDQPVDYDKIRSSEEMKNLINNPQRRAIEGQLHAVITNLKLTSIQKEEVKQEMERVNNELIILTGKQRFEDWDTKTNDFSASYYAHIKDIIFNSSLPSPLKQWRWDVIGHTKIIVARYKETIGKWVKEYPGLLENDSAGAIIFKYNEYKK
jgi:hypothetical protein